MKQQILKQEEMSGGFSSSKSFRGYPCAHRQWRHDGHCQFIHGYSREFHFEFKAQHLNDLCFVADFGGFKEFKGMLESMFDHTCLINEDDPEMESLVELHKKKVIDLRVMINVGMEGTAYWLFWLMNQYLYKKYGGRVWCSSVEVRENEKNSGTYSRNRIQRVLVNQSTEKITHSDLIEYIRHAFSAGQEMFNDMIPDLSMVLYQLKRGDLDGQTVGFESRKGLKSGR